ncbi:MFS transporter [Lactobacillus sp. DCY120]|uniref:MFS transporter n=1 Tax=Bombilactobacillus apium TaxID=2675299 RepID=A0A850QXH3_9LACO|nr:MFS transporter [Bombilactobacillus apium]NVY96514.1 MFS transporter [Bombilactobacillus apium]
MNVFLKNSNFRIFSLGSFFSTAGDILFYLALITYASKLENYSLAISLIGITETAPHLFGTIGGYFADRSANKLRSMVHLALFRAGLYLIVGFLFCQNLPGWHLVLMVIVLNFFSDSLGIYSYGLQSPTIVALVGEKQLGEAQGFNNGFNQIITMLAQFVGSGLLLVMNYSLLAVVNAGTFLVAAALFAITSRRTNLQKAKPVTSESTNINRDSLGQTLKKVYRQTIHIPGLVPSILTLTLVNGILGTMDPLFAILVRNSEQQMLILNFSFTIACYTTALGLGVASGGILGTLLFKNIPVQHFSWITALMVMGEFSMMLLRQVWLCLVFCVLVGFFAGIMGPKITKWITTSVERSILSSSMGTLNMLVTISQPLGTAIFTTVATVGGLNTSITSLIAISFLTALITSILALKITTKSAN